MCLIALSATNFSELSRDFWEHAVIANQHGLGIMYFDGAVLVTRTWSTYDVDHLLQQLARIPFGLKAAVHLRFATAGAQGDVNLHPHVRCFEGNVSMTLAVMHNGTIGAIEVEQQQGPSDTAVFVAKWLPNELGCEHADWHADTHMEAVRQFAGPQNRFVFVDSHGNWRVVGESEGFYFGKTWLSNLKARSWCVALEPASVFPASGSAGCALGVAT